MSSIRERLAAKAKKFENLGDKLKDVQVVQDATVRTGALGPIAYVDDLKTKLAESNRRVQELEGELARAGGSSADVASLRVELESARSKAVELEDKFKALQAQGTVIEVSLAELLDSPFQPRLKYDSDELERLAESLAEQGQTTAIAVRRRPDGKLELLEGHRRKRAAARAGLQTLRAVVVELSDDDAFMTVTTAANVVATTSEYEKARTFRAAKERNPELTQVQIASLYAVVPSRVSQCLSLLELPKGILELLDKEPGLVGADRVKEIRDLLKTYPETLVVEAVERLAATPKLSLTSYVKQRSQSETRPQKASRGRALKDRAGRTIGTLLIKDRVATVRLEKEVNEKAFSDALIDALGKLDLRTP